MGIRDDWQLLPTRNGPEKMCGQFLYILVAYNTQSWPLQKALWWYHGMMLMVKEVNWTMTDKEA